jgi:hypothetical protein
MKLYKLNNNKYTYMAFSKKPNHTIQIQSVEISDFSTELTKFADVTVNLNEKLINTARLLGISQDTLSKMMLSSDPLQLNNMQLINNLNVSLDNYTLDELPPQLIDYIDQIKIQLTTTSSTIDELPSYFNLLLSNTPTSSIITPTINNINTYEDNDIYEDNYTYETDDDNTYEDNNTYETYDYNSYEDDDDNSYEDDNNETNDDNIIELTSLIITPELIKNDICVICFCQLNEVVIQTNCNHQYHLHCIEQWYQIKNTCPLCKRVI